MHQQHIAQSIQKEGRISLAISAIDQSQFQSERRVAVTYDVPRSTLRLRRAGTTARRDCEPNLKKLTILEELVIV